MSTELEQAIRRALRPVAPGSPERNNPRMPKCRTLALSAINAEPNHTEIPLSGFFLIISHGSQASPRLEVAFDLPGNTDAHWIPVQKGSRIAPTDGRPFRKVLVRRRTGTGSTSDEVDFIVDDDPRGETVQETPRSPAMTDEGATLVDTELPDAAVLADNTANPTTPLVGACLMIWDGATWDRAPGTSAAGLLVDTELPAAAALADDMANPTTPLLGSCLMGYDGATWDRVGIGPGAETRAVLSVEATPATINTAQVTVNDAGGGTLIRAADAGRSSLTLYNADTTDTVYIGNSGVTTATGFALLPGEKFTIEAGAAVYGITGAGLSAPVHYWEET